jgi:hypothetical protein
MKYEAPLDDNLLLDKFNIDGFTDERVDETASA